MNQDFNPPRSESIMIEGVSYAGSAFAVTTSGDQVFVNKRIVETMGLTEGSIVTAFLLPNYEDKRANIPWRAIRVERTEVQETETESPAQAVDNAKLIADLIEEHGPLRTSSIAKRLGLSVDETGTLCMGLFARKEIAMAEVYAEVGQKRASLRVWGININDFDIDLPSCED